MYDDVVLRKMESNMQIPTPWANGVFMKKIRK
jgi:hypothetical protein